MANHPFNITQLHNNNSNNTSAPGEDFFGHGHYNHCPFWIFLAIETTAIIIGNALLCWLFVTHRKLRTKQNFFVISLSFSDLLVGFAIVPCEYCRWHRDVGELTCPLFCGSLISFNMIASVINLLIIACDRYVSVDKPFAYQNIFSKRRIVTIILVAWFLAIFMTVVPLTWELSGGLTVQTKQTTNITYAALMFGLTIIAGITLFVFYRNIVITIWKKMRSSNLPTPSNVLGVTVCVISTVVFFFSWTIYCIIEILLQCRVLVPDGIMDAGYFILLLSPCTDPLLYAYYRKDFRKSLMKWCKGRFCVGATGNRGMRLAGVQYRAVRNRLSTMENIDVRMNREHKISFFRSIESPLVIERVKESY